LMVPFVVGSNVNPALDPHKEVPPSKQSLAKRLRRLHFRTLKGFRASSCLMSLA